jgi:hypothetical protein
VVKKQRSYVIPNGIGKTNQPKEEFKMKKLSQLSIFTFTIALTVLLVLPAAQAVDFKISGQINRAMLYGDNGKNDDLKFVDNDNSSTRFRFTGSNEFEGAWTAGINWEVEMQSNPSNDTVIDIGQNDDSTDVDFNERKIEFYIEHKSFGTLTLGQGPTASDGTSEVDLSGTDVVNYASISDMNGGFNFRDGNDNIITSIGNAFSNFDGFSRRDRIRYDSPMLGPVYFSASYMNGQSYDFAGRFAYEWDGFGKLAAAASWLPADTQRDSFKAPTVMMQTTEMKIPTIFTAKWATNSANGPFPSIILIQKTWALMMMKPNPSELQSFGTYGKVWNYTVLIAGTIWTVTATNARPV